mmetsp:Transcript_94375/g.137775  ORF Transcript_94375/g.137775 Transcript_94375/m.137775 type:complete len:121 (-) Transcript_94375:54-416(-)
MMESCPHNTLQHTVNTLQHTVTRCNTLLWMMECRGFAKGQEEEVEEKDKRETTFRSHLCSALNFLTTCTPLIPCVCSAKEPLSLTLIPLVLCAAVSHDVYTIESIGLRKRALYKSPCVYH